MWLLLYPRWHVSYFLGRVGSVHHGRPIPGPTLLTKPRRAGGGEHRALPPGAWHRHRHHRHHHHHHHHLIIIMIITRAPVAPQVGRRTLTPCSAIPSDSRGSPTSYNRSSGGHFDYFHDKFWLQRWDHFETSVDTIYFCSHENIVFWTACERYRNLEESQGAEKLTLARLLYIFLKVASFLFFSWPGSFSFVHSLLLICSLQKPTEQYETRRKSSQPAV